MGLLTKAGLDEILSGGCACGGTKLAFETYVDGRFTLVGGEPYGSVTWAYKGETFVDGVFEISCVGCKKIVFTSDVCPRCNAPGELAKIMSTPNALSVPAGCPHCRAQTIVYTAMLPAHVVYEGVRAQKARPSIDMADEGFHGMRAECKSCGVLDSVKGRCPLCAAPGPLRPRPD